MTSQRDGNPRKQNVAAGPYVVTMTLNHTKIRHLQAAACLAPSAKALTAGGRVMSVIRQPR